MIRWLRLAIGIGVVAAVTLVAAGATAGADDRPDGAPGALQERLTGYEEDPLVLSTTGAGEFSARIGPGDEITYSLHYAALEGTVTQLTHDPAGHAELQPGTPWQVQVDGP